MSTVSCPACSHANVATALFCLTCGRPLAEGEAAGELIGKEILGTYRLVELLGQGGMSVVYRARHVLTDQEVAVKVLPPELSTNREVKARFIEEARTLARLEHPNIVALHNFVEADGYLYLVMQCADGETFDTVIEREGRVEAGEAVRVAIEVLRALEYAHEQGVVHRDIKPSNIIIRGDGAVKVMDFGIAKIMGSTKLTQTGQTMGTVRYMSPEQVRGKQVDHRSDIYSLGVALYEALAGRTPFDGENHFEIMQKHVSEAPPPPGRIVPLAPELEAAVLRAMAKPLDGRFQSAREFRHALQAAPVDWDRRKGTRSAPLVQVTPQLEREIARASRRRVRLFPLVVAVVLLAVSAAAVVWTVVDSGRPGAAAGKKKTARPTEADPAPAWPAPHHAARALAWRVDKRYPAPALLRVMATEEIEADPARESYLKARALYPQFLKDEGIPLEFKIRPLNLCVVDKQQIEAKQVLPAGASYPHYLPSSSTLFVLHSPGLERSELQYGFALHFCAPLTQLSDRRCLELADGFELYLRKRQPP